MLIPISELNKVWNVSPTGVLHVGAHYGEESKEYKKFKFGHITWVEAQPNLVRQLKDKLDPAWNSIIEAAVWNKNGVEMEFKIASNGESSSLLDFGTHRESYPDISFTKAFKVSTKCLRDIIPDKFHGDFLNLDIQGAELQALQGLGTRLNQFKWVYSEVNKQEVYIGCADVSELDAYLAKYNFRRVATRWVYGHGWGDALYAAQGQRIMKSNIFRRKSSQIKWKLKSAKWYVAGVIK